MKSHEWFDHDEEAGERRYFRAGKFGKRWSVITTLKSEPDWTPMDPVTLPVLEALRTLLENKYARRRVPWEDIEVLDRLVENAGGQRRYNDKKEIL